MSQLTPLEHPTRPLRSLSQRPRRYRLNGADLTRLLAILSTLVLAFAVVTAASAGTLTPFSETTEGNHSANDLQNPFDQSGLNKRFQQIWHVGLFGSDPVILTGIGFRLDAQAGFDGAPLSKVLSSLEISFGTTARAPSAITSSYATNLSDVTLQTVVNQSNVAIAGTDLPGTTVPNAFDIVFNFDAGQTFTFDPTQGLNLIMDLQTTGAGNFAPLDALVGMGFLNFGGTEPVANTASGIDSFAFAGSSNEPMALVVEFITEDAGTGGGGTGGLTAVPLPPSLALLASGIGVWGLVTARRRNRDAGPA